MIISASRRTDIPAFFSEWFFNRIYDGYLLVRNPMNIHQISRINLSPKIVDCIVFWSKNPRKILNNLDTLKKYAYYFQFTITGYGQRFEPSVPAKEEAVETFISLSKKIGRDRVIWRYDPIILADALDAGVHKINFESIAKELHGHTRRCVISFLDMYQKTARNMANLSIMKISNEQIAELSITLREICDKYNIELATCAEIVDLSAHGISHGKCIDDKLIREISGFALNIRKDATQRTECGCIASVDIGAYDTCLHECLYCYANYSRDQTRRNYACHDPHSPLLFGAVTPGDKISDRKTISCREIQETLFK